MKWEWERELIPAKTRWLQAKTSKKPLYSWLVKIEKSQQLETQHNVIITTIFGGLYNKYKIYRYTHTYIIYVYIYNNNVNIYIYIYINTHIYKQLWMNYEIKYFLQNSKLYTEKTGLKKIKYINHLNIINGRSTWWMLAIVVFSI